MSKVEIREVADRPETLDVLFKGKKVGELMPTVDSGWFIHDDNGAPMENVDMRGDGDAEAQIEAWLARYCDADGRYVADVLEPTDWRSW